MICFWYYYKIITSNASLLSFCFFFWAEGIMASRFTPPFFPQLSKKEKAPTLFLFPLVILSAFIALTFTRLFPFLLKKKKSSVVLWNCYKKTFFLYVTLTFVLGGRGGGWMVTKHGNGLWPKPLFDWTPTASPTCAIGSGEARHQRAHTRTPRTFRRTRMIRRASTLSTPVDATSVV